MNCFVNKCSKGECIDTETKKRVGLLDELRGFAIICMVVYHLMYNLKFIFKVDVPVFFDDWFYIVRSFFAGLFIFISGIVCNYSRSNLKRGVQCFFIGMVFTFVTAYVMPEEPDMFGILHCLGICMMIVGLSENILKHIPPIIGIIVCALIFMLTFNFIYGYSGIGELFKFQMPSILYSSNVMFPLGFPGKNFSSLDYFPLFPWLFLFISGAFFGVYVKNGLMPEFFYKTHFKFFALAGRYSLWIYVLHQVIIYPVLCLIFGKSLF